MGCCSQVSKSDYICNELYIGHLLIYVISKIVNGELNVQNNEVIAGLYSRIVKKAGRLNQHSSAAATTTHRDKNRTTDGTAINMDAKEAVNNSSIEDNNGSNSNSNSNSNSKNSKANGENKNAATNKGNKIGNSGVTIAIETSQNAFILVKSYEEDNHIVVVKQNISK